MKSSPNFMIINNSVELVHFLWSTPTWQLRQSQVNNVLFGITIYEYSYSSSDQFPGNKENSNRFTPTQSTWQHNNHQSEWNSLAPYLPMVWPFDTHLTGLRITILD